MTSETLNASTALSPLAPLSTNQKEQNNKFDPDEEIKNIIRRCDIEDCTADFWCRAIFWNLLFQKNDSFWASKSCAALSISKFCWLGYAQCKNFQ